MDQAHQNHLEALSKGEREGMRRAKSEEARAKQALDRAIRNLDKATPKELKKVIKEINAALNSGNIEHSSQE